MDRYYFDIHYGDRAELLRDDEGYEFESLDAAVHGAARSAAEIGTGRLGRGEVTVVIEARDERNEQVFTVTASMRIDRRDDPPRSARPDHPR